MHMLATYTPLKMPHLLILLFKTRELNPKMKFSVENLKKNTYDFNQNVKYVTK